MPTTVTVTNGSTTATVIAVNDYFKETPEDLIATITGVVDQDDHDAVSYTHLTLPTKA